MDAVWRPIAEAVMRPVLGDAARRRRTTCATSAACPASPTWTRTCAGCSAGACEGKFNLRYCGNGSLAACRTSLWTAIDQAAAGLAAELGPDPTKWLKEASRTTFVPGLLPEHDARAPTGPTFQQVLEFQGR